MPVADMRLKPVFGDDLAHVGANFRSGGYRRAGPWLEAVAESVKIAVGADARIAVVSQVPPKLSCVSSTTKLVPGAEW
jgi:hypothetical protein